MVDDEPLSARSSELVLPGDPEGKDEIRVELTHRDLQENAGLEFIDPRAHLDIGQQMGVEPGLEKAVQVPPGGRFEGLPELAGAGGGVLILFEECLQAGEENLVSQKVAEHVQDQGRFVVDDRLVGVIICEAEARPHGDGTPNRVFHRPPGQLLEDTGLGILSILGLEVKG
jgi:hypothetical protein